MAQKHYATDWAKTKSRDLVRGMLDETILKFRKPNEVTVLCYPGIDATEIFQVYDPRGIPRRNIIGVEREVAVARQIKMRVPDIQLHAGSLEDFLEQNPSLNLSVVSLDDIGPLDASQVDALQKIRERQKTNHFVLHTTNLLRRDLQSQTLYRFGYAFAHGNSGFEAENTGEYFNKALEHGVRRLVEVSNKIDAEHDIKQEKQIAYRVMVEGTMGMDYNAHALIRFVASGDYKGYLKRLEQKIREMTKLDLTLDPDNPFGSFDGTGVSPFLHILLDKALHDDFTWICTQQGLNGQIEIDCLYDALRNVGDRKKFFESKSVKSYSYISESGAPMIGLVLFLSYPERRVKASEELAREVGFPDRLSIKGPHHLRDVKKLIVKYAKESVAFTHESGNKDDIIYLGNSSKPVMTKQKAIEEFQNGATVDDVQQKYRGWTNKPLAQWKAHVTMGTYRTQRVAAEDDADLERITRQEAVDLLAAGIPAEEINVTYPTSFTLDQLRFLKSRITMGVLKPNGGN